MAIKRVDKILTRHFAPAGSNIKGTVSEIKTSHGSVPEGDMTTEYLYPNGSSYTVSYHRVGSKSKR